MQTPKSVQVFRLSCILKQLREIYSYDIYIFLIIYVSLTYLDEQGNVS